MYSRTTSAASVAAISRDCPLASLFRSRTASAGSVFAFSPLCRLPALPWARSPRSLRILTTTLLRGVKRGGRLVLA